jgi:hypothetical protein
MLLPLLSNLFFSLRSVGKDLLSSPRDLSTGYIASVSQVTSTRPNTLRPWPHSATSSSDLAAAEVAGDAE